MPSWQLAASISAPPPQDQATQPLDPSRNIAVVDEIFAAARTDIPLPLGEDRKYRIALPEDHLTRNSAVVRYYAGDRFAVYRFNRVEGVWRREDLLDAGTVGRAIVTRIARSPLGYSQVIGVLYNSAGAVRDDDWLISNKTWDDRGWNLYSEEYQTDLPFRAEFKGGIETVNDTTYEVRFDDGAYWKGERLNDPLKGKDTTCYTETCDIKFQYFDSEGNFHEVGSERVTLRYFFYVVAPVSVSISGKDTIKLEGEYTWTASASGGDGSGFSYQWEEREAGGTWSVVGGNSSTYSRFVSTAEAGKTYELRVTATSGGKSGSNTFTYVVSEDIEPPLEVTITGPSTIESSGTYTWDGSATGGAGSYSYQWEYCQSSCTPVSTSSSYSRYVELGDGDFTLYLTVTASLGQQQSTTESHYVWVAQGDDCPDCMEDPPAISGGR